MESSPTTYALQPVQKSGWNLEVGVLTGDQLLYVGKSENMSLKRGYDISIYDAEENLVISGTQQRGKLWYLFTFVLTRNGENICEVKQKRLLSREVVLTFSDGTRSTCLPSYGHPYSATSENGWRYNLTVEQKIWRVSVWDMEDHLPLLSALTYLYRNDYWNQFSSV